MRHPFPLMLFAAGFGTRMGALTAKQPKPLIKVADLPLIDHARRIAAQAGVTHQVVNLHYLGEQLADHLAGSGVALSWERDGILDTGGGLKAALPLLGNGPVLTLNTDAVWTGPNPLTRLMEAWDGARMDQLFLLLPAAQARSATGRSDFVMDDQGRVDWAKGRDGYLYLGAQIIHPRLLTGTDQAFSLHGPWTQAMAAGRAYGIVHRGDWCDVGHPGGIAEAEALLRDAKEWPDV
ncbi:nucleotidyltransferase family protein [Pseudotabrizicola alkalilacus]|uniref:Nucleotidyltransferase family protein n=1 Tax=Pseudotabrizicola alkalilacus TaxID=2305252 RepID=A0A411YY51_9RHOB|nr:nucleotidyltransferase family protein [Pseudotabrizicola alkalilacus]RGP35834.1 nucleotidyltransferase family protein [Pseudotabrizicola alkalilacus]